MLYSGFSQKKYENVYNKLIYKALELFADFSFNTLPLLEETKSTTDLKSFKSDTWCYKVLKLNKAMVYLEKNKHSDTKMSKSFRSLAEHILRQIKDTRSQSLTRKSDGSLGANSTIRTIDSNFSSNELDIMLNGINHSIQGIQKNDQNQFSR